LAARRTLRIFGHDHEISSAGSWRGAQLSPLVRYHLHYFDALRAGEDLDNRTSLEALIGDWIAANPPARGVGWEPYPTSRRIVNWIKWSLAGNTLIDPAPLSLALQARTLYRSVEHHLMGNHLLANAKALVFAGLFLDGEEPRRWYEFGIRLLQREIAEQVLDDGGHFERSPMYHSLILEDLLDLRNLMHAFDRCDDFSWDPPVVRMLQWLNSMSHPDGEICLFNDSALNLSPRPADLRDYAERLGVDAPADVGSTLIHLASTGYARRRQGRVTTFVDVGPIGPDYIPGHSHADTLTFELSVSDQRVIVDTGTSEYTPAEIREAERSTAAHNTVRVDKQDSSEVWASFRVARRAIVRAVRVRENEISAEHDGYRRLPGVGVHRRSWSWGEDHLLVKDCIEGSGTHELDWYLHFHPLCELSVCDGNELRVSTPDGHGLRIVVDSKLAIGIEDGWYAPEFGVRQPNRILKGAYRGLLPIDFTARILWEPESSN
jgi:uncharacterized heparinase superfamily protein